jgi:hypothetical protein
MDQASRSRFEVSPPKVPSAAPGSIGSRPSEPKSSGSATRNRMSNGSQPPNGRHPTRRGIVLRSSKKKSIDCGRRIANCVINLPVDSDASARQRHDPHANLQLSISFLERAPDNAGSACVMSRQGGRPGPHYAWLPVGPRWERSAYPGDEPGRLGYESRPGVPWGNRRPALPMASNGSFLIAAGESGASAI